MRETEMKFIFTGSSESLNHISNYIFHFNELLLGYGEVLLVL